MSAFSRTYGLCLAFAASLSSGCLSKQVTHTLYLDPAGVTWSVVENDVHSVDADAVTQLVEEQDYLLAARAGRHPAANAFTLLGASRVKTLVVRADRPFAVKTEGRFADLAAAVRAIIARAGVRGDATIERDGCRRTFRAWVDASQEPSDGIEDVVDLIGDPDSYRVVLTQGRFTDARGFTIADNGLVAIPAATDPGEDGISRVSLTWNEGCGVTR